MAPMWSHSTHDWFFPFGGLLFLIVIGAVIFATVMLARARRPEPPPPKANEILDSRLARGEIDETEHARLKEVIRK